MQINDAFNIFKKYVLQITCIKYKIQQFVELSQVLKHKFANINYILKKYIYTNIYLFLHIYIYIYIYTYILSPCVSIQKILMWH